jgi:hypothetical protein
MDHGPGLAADIVRHPDHTDMFTWRRKRTGQTTSGSGHSRDASAYNPAYAQSQDYHYDRPDPDLTKFRRLEAIVDVNPFKAKHRLETGHPDTTYRTDFRNFYPERLDAQYLTTSTQSPRSRTFIESQKRAPVDPLRGQIRPNPFDIESRQLIGVEEDIDSIYRHDYIDHANPPIRKGERRRETTETLPSWDTYIPDKPRKTDLNPFDLSVRGPVPSKFSTLYRDNYVDFLQREPMRTLDD